MIGLAKYLKPSLLFIFLSVVLLFGQAMCDLKLPNYMSNIVNIGIQQSGVEEAAPLAISQKGMHLITAFMTDDEKQLVAENYVLSSIEAQNADGETLRSVYPLGQEQLYLMKNTDPETTVLLDLAFGTAAFVLVELIKDSGKAGNLPENISGSEYSIDLNRIYQIFPFLSTLPDRTISIARDKALANDPAMLKQGGIMLAKAFYAELGVDINNRQSNYIVRIGLLMLLVAFLGGAASISVGFLSARIAAGTARDIRQDVFAKVESFSNNEFDRFSSASLITRCTNDITQIQELLMLSIRIMFYAPIIGFGAIIMAVSKSPSMTWIIALALLCLLSIMPIIMLIAIPKFKAIQKLIDRLNLVSRENLTGMAVIRAFSAQAFEKSRFDDANKNLLNTTLFVNRLMILMMPAMMLIMNGVTLMVIWFGAHQIAASSLQVGDMMAFIQYAIQVVMSFLMMSMMFILVPRAAVSAQRISEVLKTEISITDPAMPETIRLEDKGLVEFKNVCFRYQGAEKNTLDDISFTAPPGQTTAIIGPTGSGKTTVANLILRFYDVNDGQVLVNGVDVRRLRQEELRSTIGYVPQKGVLLSGTVASNLKYGKTGATDTEVQLAANVAQATEFIGEMPEGFLEPIARGGANVSGGQRQRLSIARALVKNPDILIFDDSFSALDYKTDAVLRKALKTHTADSTVIIVTQRINTILDADQIIVLVNGRVTGRGKHKELIETCPEYYEIASSQLTKEELA